VREFLGSRGIGFDSINVLESEDGRAALRRLGARSVPVVARGDAFVFAQSIRDVVAFLGLDAAPGPELSPQELVGKLDLILSAAGRYTLQMPEAALETQQPNRPRSYRELLYHIFQIPDAFLEMTRGRTLDYEMLVAPPPAEMRTTGDIAAYGEGVRRSVLAWWNARDDKTCSEDVPTYYGAQPPARGVGAHHVAPLPARAAADVAAGAPGHPPRPAAERRRPRGLAPARGGLGPVIPAGDTIEPG